MSNHYVYPSAYLILDLIMSFLRNFT